jgi:citrate lyase gamma subunit
MTRGWLAAAAALLLAGCASSGGVSGAPQKNTTMVSVSSNLPTVTALAASRETVFAALDSAYAATGVAVGMRDPANWTLGNRNLQVSRRLNGRALSTFFNCGNTGMGAEVSDSYRLHISIVSTVVAQGAGSRLETVAQAVARQQGTSSPPVNCASTGELEKAIAARVSTAVGG